MATPLTPAHRTWRIKVFVATWLSYVGFYFCRKPFSAAKSAIGEETGWDATTLGNIWAAYLIAYSVGQFLASSMGTRLGPRKNVLLGMGLSIVVTLGMGVSLSAPVMAGLVAVNGLAQATGWSGNVGTMASWFHKQERGRVMGVWSTNFTIGSLVSGFAMAWVLGMHGDGEPDPWRWCFYGGGGVLAIVWLQFFLFQRNRPEDVGLAPIDDPSTVVDESREPALPPEGFMGLSRSAWTNLMLVAGFYFFAKLIRYAMWSWSAYFLERNYELSSTQANVYAVLFDLFGIPGVYLTGWISDRYFKSRRAGVALIFMLGMMVVTALLTQFGGSSVTVFAILLAGVGFTLYGPDALLSGAGAMDIGGKHAVTFATGVIAGFGAMGPVVQELVISRLYDSKGPDFAATHLLEGFFHISPHVDPDQLRPIFVLLFLSAAMATVFCALLVWRNRRGNGI
ncbi:MAG: MFS transporter [Deltaproteobacteria bacterium]|nr:MFS transporter [Deltaproteobacteria bacterium]